MNGHVAQLRGRLSPEPHGRRRLLSLPGCWDGLSALMIEQAGFEAAFVTGGGVAMARFGRPDLGLVTATELSDTVAAIRDRVALPLIVDGDTGFGNALNVQRTVRTLERAGASAIQIEDQSFPKRCGHMAGKSVIPLGEAVGKIAAAVDARFDALIVARTDAVAVEGLEVALDRAEAYLAAGADLLFIEGPGTMAETLAVAARFADRVPLVHNLVEGGRSATNSGVALEEMGFAVALHPLVLLHGFVAAAPDWLAQLAADRSTAAFADRIATLDDLNRITGADALSKEARRYG